MSDAWVPSATALISLAIGSLVTLYTVRRQVTASLTSSSRQEWINTLRDAVAEFLSVTAQLRYHVLVAPSTEWHKVSGFERAIFLQSKIALLSNPKEEDHRRLNALISEAQSLTGCLQDADAVRQAAQLHHDITDLTQAILKREWNRVKKGEPAFAWK